MDLQDLPPEVHDCTESVMDDNPDLDKSQAIGICRDQLDMQEAGDDCPDGHVQVAGECVEIEEAEIVPPRDLSNGATFQLANLDTEPIEREELGDDATAYRNIRLLDTGVWTDKKSQTPTYYGEEGMRNLEPAWDDGKYDGPPVNIMHDEDRRTGEPNETSVGGYIDPESIAVDNGALYGDLILETDTSAGAYADDNFQTALESRGSAGFGGPSVELDIDPRNDIQASDHPRAKEELTGGKLTGVALVMDPASKSSSFARQTAERAVALSDGSRETPMVYHLEADDMTDATVPTDALLEAFDVDADDVDLGDDVELADVPVTELVALIAESYGADPAEIMDALDPFIDGDGEGEDVEAQEEEDEEEEDENEGEGDEEDENDADVDIDMEEQVSALEERIADLEAMVDSLMAAEDVEEATADLADAETVKELADTVESLEDTAEELDERARKLEAEPEKPKALAGDGGEEADAPTGRISEITPSKRY